MPKYKCNANRVAPHTGHGVFIMTDGNYLVTMFGRHLPGKVCRDENEVRSFLKTWFHKELVDGGHFVRQEWGFKFVNSFMAGPEIAQIVKI